MAKEIRALVNEDGSLVSLQEVEASKIAVSQDWPKYYPVVRVDNPPTSFHGRVGESASLQGGNWTITGQYELQTPLEVVKDLLKSRIDARAEAERLKFITQGAGQAMSYEANRTEARRWVLAGEPTDPSEDDYPWASGRAQRKGMTIAAVLAEWKATSGSWAQVAIAIEGIREGAKEFISAASSVEAACQTFEEIDWILE